MHLLFEAQPTRVRRPRLGFLLAESEKCNVDGYRDFLPIIQLIYGTQTAHQAYCDWPKLRFARGRFQFFNLLRSLPVQRFLDFLKMFTTVERTL
jgi:hypothetical protein